MNADMIGIDTLGAGLARIARRISDSRDYLNELDGAIGDADFGTTIQGSCDALLATPPSGATPGALLKSAGMLVMRVQGGASGPLFGTMLREAGKAAGDIQELDAPALAAMLRAAVDGVTRLGKSQPGDKTLVDALEPAASAFEDAAKLGGSPAECAAAAAKAAREGAEATRLMIAKRGRAHYVGERGLGHPDAGAIAIAMCFELFAPRAE